MSQQKRGEKLKCPYCNKEQDEPVEDYICPNTIGVPFIDDCGDCGKSFVVNGQPLDTFSVEKA